jgi:hypothetical protein
MSDRLGEWHKRIHFPRTAKAHLGFGAEHWDLDPKHYEGWEELRDRLVGLGRKPTKRRLACDLASHLLDDVIVAAGGLERAIIKLREALATLHAYVRDQNITVGEGIPMDLAHDGSVEAWYAFSDVLSWSRTVVERLERPPRNRKKFPTQGLIPALRAKRLRKRCEDLFVSLRQGAVGQARPLANFVLHGALVRHPFSGVQLDTSGAIVLPIPDSRSASHWYLLTWDQERDGFIVADELWTAVQSFIDDLLSAFERSVPRRLRRTT